MKLSTLCLLLLFGFNATAKEEILWYHPNFPPANFVDGLMEGLGHNDQAEKFIAGELSQYQHKYIMASYQRIIHSLKFGEGCVVGIYKSNEREKKLTFSIPYLLTFPNGLVFKERNLNKFLPFIDKEGLISIKLLLDNERLLAGVADGREYKGTIDRELDLHRHKDNILVRSNNDVFSGLLQMLDKGRVDYIFGFPEELEHHTSLGVLDNKMKFLPIKEMPKFLTSYIACSKNDWGEKIIKDINSILMSHRKSHQFLRFYEFWLDFDSKKRHRQISNDELSPVIN